MKNRKIVVTAFVLIAALMLGIGYAALTDTLSITGSAGVDLNDAKEAFDGDIYFSKVISGTGCTAEILTDKDTGKITVTDGALKEVGNEVIATYTVKSESDLDTKIKVPAIVVSNSDYFDVTTTVSNDATLVAGGTLDITVTVRLKKTADTDQDTTFTITFDAESVN